MTVRELLKQILYYEVAEIRDFEGKNLIARTFTIEDLDRFYDCEVKDFNYDLLKNNGVIDESYLSFQKGNEKIK